MERWKAAPLALAILAAGGTAAGAKPTASDPRDAALAAFMGEATAQILAASRGEPTDPGWGNVGESYEGLAATPAETVESVQALGATVEVLATFLELEATVEGGRGTIYLRTGAIVYPDGGVRWLQVEARDGPGIGGDADLARVAPALAGAVDRVVETLRSPACALPLVTDADLAAFPAPVRAEAGRAEAGLKAACTQLAGLEGSWLPRIDDVSVMIRGTDGRTAMLKSGFEPTGTGVGLYPVRFRAIE